MLWLLVLLDSEAAVLAPGCIYKTGQFAGFNMNSIIVDVVISALALIGYMIWNWQGKHSVSSVAVNFGLLVLC